MGPTPVATIQSARTLVSLSLNVCDFGCIVITGEAIKDTIHYKNSSYIIPLRCIRSYLRWLTKQSNDCV